MDHLAEVLFQLFVLLAATKIGDELFKRIGQPPLVGEILAGVIVGPALLGWYQITPETELFAQIGAVLLLFEVGVHTRVGDLVRVGGTAVTVAVLGVVLPFIGGFAVATAMGFSIEGRVFLAAALTATSVGITSRALDQLGALKTGSGRIVLGAAVIDDVLAMLIVAVAVGMASGGVDAGDILLTFGLAAAFIVIVLVAGTGILSRRRSLLTEPRFAETPLLPGMILMLGLAALSAAIGLAAIIGAFLAGMVVGESSEREALEKETAPIAALFTPFFFGFVGAQIDITVFGTPSTVALLLGITALAIVTKFAGAFLGALRVGRERALLIGWAMVPRGEVEIIVAGLALAAGAFGPDLYLVVVGMVVITSLVVPPFMPRLVRRAEPGIGIAQAAAE
ncbi:MAG TPA: cation:proton antiporter [Candidatus Limnocylindria bacterium]|nr:cation:proton antiporter [Candidatus Limnocylindria bacterium]